MIMVGLAADDGSQRDDGLHFGLLTELRRGRRQLERAWEPRYIYVALRDSAFQQGCPATRQQTGTDFRVEFTHRNGNHGQSIR